MGNCIAERQSTGAGAGKKMRDLSARTGRNRFRLTFLLRSWTVLFACSRH